MKDMLSDVLHNPGAYTDMLPVSHYPFVYREKGPTSEVTVGTFSNFVA